MQQTIFFFFKLLSIEAVKAVLESQRGASKSNNYNCSVQILTN